MVQGTNEAREGFGTFRIIEFGQLRVVSGRKNFPVAKSFFLRATTLLRGDICGRSQNARPPLSKGRAVEHFAPVAESRWGCGDRKSIRDARRRGYTMYVNLGASQGVEGWAITAHFRYQGKNIEYPAANQGLRVSDLWLWELPDAIRMETCRAKYWAKDRAERPAETRRRLS